MEEREIYIEQENNQEQEINIVSENIIMDGSVTDVTVNGTSVVQEGIAEIDLINYATKEYVEQEIATFDFIKIVQELPTTGLPNRTYLVSKTNATDNDLYDEYIWVNKGTEEEPNWGWEFLGTKKIEVDLTDYVKNTDYANNDKYGVVKTNNNYGIQTEKGSLYIRRATEPEIKSRSNQWAPITPANLDYAVKNGITTNSLEWSEEEKTSARSLIGAIGDNDINHMYGIKQMSDTDKTLTITPVNANEMKLRNTWSWSKYRAVRLSDFDYLLKLGLIDNKETLTDEEKTSARSLIGAIGPKDIATQTKPGLVAYSSTYGIQLIGSTLSPLTWKSFVDNRQNAFMTYANLDYAVVSALTNNSIELTEEQKTAIKNWLGIS